MGNKPVMMGFVNSKIVYDYICLGNQHGGGFFSNNMQIIQFSSIFFQSGSALEKTQESFAPFYSGRSRELQSNRIFLKPSYMSPFINFQSPKLHVCFYRKPDQDAGPEAAWREVDFAAPRVSAELLSPKEVFFAMQPFTVSAAVARGACPAQPLVVSHQHQSCLPSWRAWEDGGSSQCLVSPEVSLWAAQRSLSLLYSSFKFCICLDEFCVSGFQ